jgi:hypothetical protein
VPGGIFCIENWSGNLASRDTVAPLLRFLVERQAARVIHRQVETQPELRHYLSRFAALESYSVGYIAMHGARGQVRVGAKSIDLETLIEWSDLRDGAPALDLETEEEIEWTLDLTGKVLYLGSCATLHVPPERLKAFRKKSGALAVCGYTRDVEWIESGAFDIMLLSSLAEATEGSPSTVHAAVKRLRKHAGDLLDNLGFVCEPDWRP